MSAYFSDLVAQFTNPVTAIAQIFGFSCVILSYFIFRNISRKASLIIKVISDALWATHFFLLQQWTGGVLNCLNIFRGICFYQRGEKKWASGVWMPILFCTASVIGSVLGWTGPESLLPMAGSCLIIMGFWTTETGRLRRLNFFGLVFWMIYSVLILSVPAIVGNGLSMISIILTELRVNRQQRTKENTEC
jgi:hypothetical protein